MLKILVFSSSPPKTEAGYSGGIRRFFEITKRWVIDRNIIYMIASNRIRRIEKLFNTGIFAIYYHHFSFKGLGDFINIRRMLRNIPNEKFDFIYCPGEDHLPVLTSTLAKRKYKIPLILCVNLFDSNQMGFFKIFRSAVLQAHTYYESSESSFFRIMLSCIYLGLITSFKISLRNLCLKKADLIFAVSTQIKKRLVQMGLDENRIFVVGGGIYYSEIKSTIYPKKKYAASFLGRIAQKKGIFDLIDMWKEIVKQHPRQRLLVIGDGDPKIVNEVKRRIMTYNLQENIIMPGFVTGKNKYRLLKESKVFVFPSYAEGFAQVVCEAMACGLPVIAYDLPEYKEWYGEHIAYVQTGDLNDLLHKTLQLLRNKKLRDEMGRKGVMRAKNYSWDSVSEYELEVITRTLIHSNS